MCLRVNLYLREVYKNAFYLEVALEHVRGGGFCRSPSVRKRGVGFPWYAFAVHSSINGKFHVVAGSVGIVLLAPVRSGVEYVV